MKKIITLLSLLLFFASCHKESDRPVTPLRLGEDDAKELQVTQSETRMILLKGGDGKYSATIEDARIASSSISRDTLRVSGILYGETSLTIRSHDEVRRVRVKVVPPISKTQRRRQTSNGKPPRVSSRSRPSMKGISSSSPPAKTARPLRKSSSRYAVSVRLTA